MTTPDTSRPATQADVERILAEVQRLLQSAPPAAFAGFWAAVRELKADPNTTPTTPQAGDFEARV